MKRDLTFGIVFGFIVCAWIFHSPWSDLTKYRLAIKECEQSLPRDQHCKIIGVPIVPVK